MPHSLTDGLTTLKDRATQLLIKYKSGALVTQIVFVENIQNFQNLLSVLSGNFPDHPENIKTIRKLSRLSGIFLGYLEIFQATRKLSKLSWIFPNYPEIFQTVRKLPSAISRVTPNNFLVDEVFLSLPKRCLDMDILYLSNLSITNIERQCCLNYFHSGPERCLDMDHLPALHLPSHQPHRGEVVEDEVKYRVIQQDCNL